MRAIVGTAGHIDHGKTALVRALTGIDTDRLPEEQQRGISIELGFAFLDLPEGDRAGIVDVPGHERFVRQMLAGAQGFDLLLLVVAADDGVMPQTEEHFEICHLLGVREAMVVITKTDLVDRARIDEVRTEVEILVAGTGFEHAPVFEVSATTGQGIDALRSAIIAVLGRVEHRDREGPFRLPVDRVFVLKGHGVVVTGTATGGRVAPGDELTIVPAGRTVRVREVQVHERSVEYACAGQRVALNLAGVDREDVERGQCLVAMGVPAETQCFDAVVEIRPSARRPVRSHQRVRVYLGTSDRSGRIRWLGGSSVVEPRSRGYAQIFVTDQLVAFSGDRFVLRDETACRTIGGGVVLVARAARHRRDRAQVVERLEQIEKGSAAVRLKAFVESVPGLGMALAQVALELATGEEKILDLARSSQELCLLPTAADSFLVVSATRYRQCIGELTERVRTFHEEHPSSAGIELERLRNVCGLELDQRGIRTLVDVLVDEGTLARVNGRIALPDHRPSVKERDMELASQILDVVREGGTMPPSLKQLEERYGVPARTIGEIVSVLADRGDLVKVSSELVFSSAVIKEVEERLRTVLSEQEQITAAGFRDLIGATRKYSIPLLDYFDRSAVTVRQGDYRRLRSS